MPRITIEHDSRLYSVSPDDPVPPALRYQALVTVRLVDELTGEGVDRGVWLETSEIGLVPRVSGGGIAGFAGVPLESFPDLTASPYDINFVVASDGFIRETRRATILAHPGFPLTFEPHDVGDLDLHTTAVVIEGRVVEDDGTTRTPVVGAPVEVTEIWLTLPTATLNSVEPPLMAAIAPPLYAAREDGVASVRRREMVPAAGAPMRVTDFAEGGGREMRLFDSAVLNAGDIIEIEFADANLPQHDPARLEFIAVEAIDRVDPSLPSVLTLVHPLAFDHSENTFVRRVVPQAAGPATPLSRRALATEECVFVNGVAGLAGAQVVEVIGGVDLDGNPLAPEYHRVLLFGVTTDADGYFRLPPLSRVAQVTIEATIGPDTPSRPFNPDYTLRINRCDIVHAA